MPHSLSIKTVATLKEFMAWSIVQQIILLKLTRISDVHEILRGENFCVNFWEVRLNLELKIAH